MIENNVKDLKKINSIYKSLLIWGWLPIIFLVPIGLWFVPIYVDLWHAQVYSAPIGVIIGLVLTIICLPFFYILIRCVIKNNKKIAFLLSVLERENIKNSFLNLDISLLLSLICLLYSGYQIISCLILLQAIYVTLSIVICFINIKNYWIENNVDYNWLGVARLKK